MKKLFLVIVVVLALLLTGSNKTESIIDTGISANNVRVASGKEASPYEQASYGKPNDLVYHDYGTGVKLSEGDSLTIKKLDLKLTDETAALYVINMEKNEVFLLCDYQPKQDITYAPDSDGIYKIIAKISNGTIKDMTQIAAIATGYKDKNNSGFILLK